MGWTEARSRVERPGYDAWIGVSPELRRYIGELERVVDAFEQEQFVREQLHEEDLRRRERLLIDKDAQIAHLERELRTLRESARLSSRNSSKPPSTDPPSAPKRPRPTGSGKRRGGQPGHPKHERSLVPLEACASVTDHRPDACERCHAPLVGEDPEPLRHQTFELPVVEPIVVEHRLHSLSCACGHVTRACLPEQANPTGFGPRLEATVATLSGACRLSHRMIAAVMGEIFGVSLGLGTVTKLLERVSAALEEPVDEARHAAIVHDGAKHADETGWFQRGADGTNEEGKRAWLWVVATASVVAFRVALSRSQAVARELLGELTHGIVVSDRYLVYRYIGVHARQLCWAHLRREFERISERSGASGRVGRGLTAVAKEVFATERKYAAGEVSAEARRQAMGRLRQRAREWLERGASFDVRADERSERSRTKRTCEEMLKLEPAMWTFVREAGVEVTNNRAERALRHAVLWRRASFGSQSQAGAERTARLLTVVMTRRAQGKSTYRYFVEACEAARRGDEAPRLVG